MKRQELTKVLSAKAIINMQKLVRSVPAGEYVIDYALRLVRALAAEGSDRRRTLSRSWSIGAADHVPANSWSRGGQAFAAMDGRFSVALDDIKKAAIPVLRHRISTNFQAQADGKTSEDIVRQLLEVVGDPEPPKYEKRKRV